jgi:hypothetical protein
LFTFLLLDAALLIPLLQTVAMLVNTALTVRPVYLAMLELLVLPPEA